MSTRQSFYQLRRQKSRYDLPSCQVEEWNEWWVSETTVPRDALAAIAVLSLAVVVLFCMLWCACDMAVDLARQAYGAVI